MSKSSIWPIDRNLSDAMTPVQSGPGSNVNEGVHYTGHDDYSIHQCPGIPGFNPRLSHAKDLKNGTDQG